MSSLVMLILPRPAKLDSIRSCLAPRFRLNTKVEGLGDAEELVATDPAGGITTFETVLGGPSDELRALMRKRSLAPDKFTHFWARFGGKATAAAAQHVATSLRGWLFDEWSTLWSPCETQETQPPPQGCS
jgi:hypothetical protein